MAIHDHVQTFHVLDQNPNRFALLWRTTAWEVRDDHSVASMDRSAGLHAGDGTSANLPGRPCRAGSPARRANLADCVGPGLPPAEPNCLAPLSRAAWSVTRPLQQQTTQRPENPRSMGSSN